LRKGNLALHAPGGEAVAEKGNETTMLPLQGIRVIELGQNLAGPFASEILGTLGAEVVKVERPEGDDCRGWGPPFHDGAACTFQTMNRGKRSIALDLKNPKALAWLREHIGEYDVLVQNLRPGVMEKIELDAEALRGRYPRLVYCSLWAFGAKGPMRLNPGYEPVIQAFAGMFSVNGSADQPPARFGAQVLDLGTGLWAALGCIAALFRRAQTGEGATVDASLFETAMGWLTVHFATFNKTGRQAERHRTGNPRVVVFQAFDTADGEIVIAAANDRLFAKLAKELGHPEWAERYPTNAARYEHKPELIPQIEMVIRTRPTAEWVERLEAQDIPCSPINDLRGVAAEPQTEAMGIFQEPPGLGLKLVGLPISLDGERPAATSRAPGIGQHNAELGVPSFD
jgi:crotonobetainyl-CoA:carnitine CoA-transferase CaiB-like acyl-CoA transferase